MFMSLKQSAVGNQAYYSPSHTSHFPHIYYLVTIVAKLWVAADREDFLVMTVHYEKFGFVTLKRFKKFFSCLSTFFFSFFLFLLFQFCFGSLYVVYLIFLYFLSPLVSFPFLLLLAVLLKCCARFCDSLISSYHHQVSILSSIKWKQKRLFQAFSFYPYYL